MVAWQVAILVLVALFIGISIPVLLQARASLKEAGALLRAAGERIPLMLEEAYGVVHRANLVSEGLKGREERIGEIVEAAGDVAETVARMKGSARVASTVGAAIAGAVKAYREVAAGVPPEEIADLEAEEARAAEAHEFEEREPERPPGPGAAHPESQEAA